MKSVAIIQSNYIPWKGYFDMIAAADEFIIYDDMQYTRRDWRNRNQIKTPQGAQWLTVPVKIKGRYLQEIRDTEIDRTDWAVEHWKTITMNYKRSVHFREIAEWLEPMYLQRSYKNLSELNRALIESICNYLAIKTKIVNSWNYEVSGGKTERLALLCKQSGSDRYISGPAARAYIDESIFADYGIKVCWFDYAGYPAYPQLWGLFIHNVSILDLLFNCGNEAFRYMKHLK
jgi:hypothetical protein